MFVVSLFLVLSYMLPQGIDTKPTLVFFTGGNSFMPSFIYSNFISKLKESNNVKVINNLNYKKENTILEELLDIYKKDNNFIPISHSSGATTLLNYCSKFDIKKCILMDPVDNNQFINKEKILDVKNYDNVLILNADKSYKWNIKLPTISKIPFIPIGRLNYKNFKSYTQINFKDTGHCDILDDPYSNFMNNNLAEGLEDREKVLDYQKSIVNIINLYTADNLNNETVKTVDNFNIDIDFN